MLSENTGANAEETAGHGGDTDSTHGTVEKMDVQPPPAGHGSSAVTQTTDAVHSAEQKTSPVHIPAPVGMVEPATEVHDADESETPSFPVVGMAFVDAVIQPLDDELNQRFFGWRPIGAFTVPECGSGCPQTNAV